LWAGRRRERVVWRETDDGQKAVNMRMVEWLSIEELGGGRHPDDHYALRHTCHPENLLSYRLIGLLRKPEMLSGS
jgi:hypothetical protein